MHSRDKFCKLRKNCLKDTVASLKAVALKFQAAIELPKARVDEL